MPRNMGARPYGSKLSRNDIIDAQQIDRLAIRGTREACASCGRNNAVAYVTFFGVADWQCYFCGWRRQVKAQ